MCVSTRKLAESRMCTVDLLQDAACCREIYWKRLTAKVGEALFTVMVKRSPTHDWEIYGETHTTLDDAVRAYKSVK